MPLSLVTEPVNKALTLAQAKDHLRVEHNEEDCYIESLISCATEYVQNTTGCQLITATYRLTLDCFPDGADTICLLPPVQSVTSINYVDTQGVSQLLPTSDYYTDILSSPARLVPAYSKVWPTARLQPSSVVIEFITGFGDEYKQVPETIREAMRLLVAHWYDIREPVVLGGTPQNVPMTVDALLWQKRVITFV